MSQSHAIPPPEAARERRRIVLTTFGSFGDLHPYMALALELRRRGHEPIIATFPLYREKVEAAGLGFRAIPAFGAERPDAELIKRIMDGRRGTEFIIRHLVMPVLRTTYEQTLIAAEGADLLVAHPLSMTTRLVAEVRGIPWVSTQLAPCGFLSPHDPPVLSPTHLFGLLRRLGPRVNRPLFQFLKRAIRSWCEPQHRLRADLGLPPETHPLFEGNNSPTLILALFSRLLGSRQPDWPAQTVLTGFAFHDQDDGVGLDPALARFLDAGTPPIVFTLGTAAVLDAGRFYEQSVAAAQRLGMRAVLLVGKDTENRPSSLPDGVVAFDYAPFSELFPRAAAIVHQGGVGTTGQAMRAGRPMLVMPYAHDQPDNADRVRRLGIARTIPRSRYNADRAAQELAILLTTPSYADQARKVGEGIRQETGVQTACDALEPFLTDSAARSG